MRPGSRERVLSVEETVRQAARVCDPEHGSDAAAALVESFEGDERPATAPEDLAAELRSVARNIDPEALQPEVWVAAATAHWLATNSSAAADPERAIREGVRLFFGDDAPGPVSDWLAIRGLT